MSQPDCVCGDPPHSGRCGEFTGIGPCPCPDYEAADEIDYPDCECGHDEGVHAPSGTSCGDCDGCTKYRPVV